MTADAVMREILGSFRTIAVVGASDDPDRAGNYIPAYLKQSGYRIIPVNPNVDEVLGEKSYPSLRDIPEPVEVVEVFRRPEFTPDVVRDAIAIGAEAVWLQLGIVNDEARRLAEEAGLLFVQDECMGPQHRRLLAS
ncbi:MAG TPA: CoA-binding protein [Actinomycetota bacterium]|nr:CoA-binding protein [Actinomycetota bacterium]